MCLTEATQAHPTLKQARSYRAYDGSFRIGLPSRLFNDAIDAIIIDYKVRACSICFVQLVMLHDVMRPAVPASVARPTTDRMCSWRMLVQLLPQKRALWQEVAHLSAVCMQAPSGRLCADADLVTKSSEYQIVLQLQAKIGNIAPFTLLNTLTVANVAMADAAIAAWREKYAKNFWCASLLGMIRPSSSCALRLLAA